MTKSQELFYKAGVYKERAKLYLELRKHAFLSHWDMYTEKSKKLIAKSERFLVRAYKEAANEKHDLVVSAINSVPDAQTGVEQ